MMIHRSCIPLAAACFLSGFISFTRAEEILVERGAKSTWSYLDTGTAPDKAWTSAAFEAKDWKSGPAPLGYGEEDLGTTVSFGANKQSKAVTTWFRRTVEVKDAAKVANLYLQLRRDDGAVVYWNGKEIARSNMPAGEVKPDTLAADALSDDVEADLQYFVVPANDFLQTGKNVVAVEIHQSDPRSSDLAFDLEVSGWAANEKPPEPPKEEKKEPPGTPRTADIDRLIESLLRADPKTPGYARRLTAAAQVMTRGGTVSDDRVWTLLDKARAAAPDDMEVVYTWIRARVDARKDLPIKPAKRELSAAIPKEFRFIADTPEGPQRGRPLPREELLADVDDLELILENCYAYLERRGANYRGALDALRASLTEDAVPVEVFAHRVARVLTVFGDPHSRLQWRSPEMPLPLSFVMDGDKLAVTKPDRSGFLEEGHPLVEKINGTPAAEWLAAAEEIVPQASPQFRRHLALEQLAALRTVARQLQRQADAFTLTLTAEDGTDPKEYLVPRRGTARRSEGPGSKSEVRKDGLGYLRVALMDSGDDFTASLNDWMKKFKDTRGLIIDVRGNGGGTQDGIKTLLPWFMKPGSPMKIINVAAYRLPVELPQPNPSGFLGLHGRGLHPATSKVWTTEQAEQIRTFLKTWEPKWKLPAGKFSDWHVMSVSHETNPDAGYYDKPVIVLQDEGCFSATDNFLGALKAHPNITLMGTTSGGGSGRMADYTLPNSHLSLTLCQMASFATTGLMYDGNGVPPDVVVTPKVTDYLTGKGDSVLDAAVAKLGK